MIVKELQLLTRPIQNVFVHKETSYSSTKSSIYNFSNEGAGCLGNIEWVSDENWTDAIITATNSS
jgi:hypothetical protein